MAIVSVIFFIIFVILSFRYGWRKSKAMNDLAKLAAQQVDQGGAMKICPYCAERIRAAAIVCRYCNREQPKQPDIHRAKAEEVYVDPVTYNSRGRIRDASQE